MGHSGDDLREAAAGVYCKVFAKRNGRVTFHKDGYCDLRGMFDYSSVTGGPRLTTLGGGGTKYAVLVTSPRWGSLVHRTS